MLGRDREWGEILSVLRRVTDGLGGVVLITGERGIGKSFLLAEARTAAAAQSFSVAAAAANELERLIPLSPLLAAVGESGEGLTMLAQSTETGDVRMRLISLVRARLEERVSGGPALVCLDDVDRADQVTLLALRILTRHLASDPLVWLLSGSVAASRDVRQLFDLLVDDGAVRIELDALTDAAVADLVTEVLGAEPDAGLVKLAASADGNPFVLTELLNGLREEGALLVSAGAATLVSDHVPKRFQHLTRDRVESLGFQTRRLLEAGAVLGPSFALEDVAEMLRLPPAALVPAVGEALAAGIAVASGEAIAFRHVLLWNAIVASIPPPVLRALHRQVGEVLLDRGGAAMPAAVHLLNGARQGDNRLLDGLGRAAREVMASSPQTAADLATRALELTDPADPERDERLLTAVETLAAAHRLAQAGRLITAALAKPVPLLLRARLRSAMSSILRMNGRPEEARTEAEAVLAMSYLPGRVRDEAQVVLLQALTGLPDKRQASAQSMAILATGEGRSDIVVLAALAVRAAICWDEGRLAEGLELSRQAVALVKRDPLDARALQPYLDLASRLVDIREFDEATAMLAVADGAGSGHPGKEPGPAILRARRDLAAGRLDDAAAEAQSVLGVIALLGSSPYAVLAESVLAIVALRRGDLHAAENHLQEAVGYATPDQAGPDKLDLAVRVQAQLAVVAAQIVEARSGPHAALELSVGIYDEIFRDRWLLIGEPAIAPWLVRTALAADDRARAAAVAAVADEIARENKAIQIVRSVAAHTRGLLSHDAGLLRQAAEQHVDVWLRATATEDLGTLLVGAGQLIEAVERFDQSLSGYEQTGATRDAARIRRRLRQLGVRRRHWTTADRPVQGWDSMTDTERRIAELVSEGLSNRQAGEQMFISAHTVAFHLRQIFRKLSIGSRAELARLTAEHDRGVRPDLLPGKPAAQVNHPVGGCEPIGAAMRLEL